MSHESKAEDLATEHPLDLEKQNKKIWLVKVVGLWRVELQSRSRLVQALKRHLWLVEQVPNAVARVWRPLCEQAMNSTNLEEDSSNMELGKVQFSKKDDQQASLPVWEQAKKY